MFVENFGSLCKMHHWKKKKISTCNTHTFGKFFFFWSVAHLQVRTQISHSFLLSVLEIRHCNNLRWRVK